MTNDSPSGESCVRCYAKHGKTSRQGNPETKQKDVDSLSVPNHTFCNNRHFDTSWNTAARIPSREQKMTDSFDEGEPYRTPRHLPCSVSRGEQVLECIHVEKP